MSFIGNINGGTEDKESEKGVSAELYTRTHKNDIEGESGECTCTACAHRCTLSEGQEGVCKVRKNVDGDLRLLTYGKVYDTPHGPPGTPDPVEKKPLYHFKPTTRILSFGGASCNFSCDFCQNNHISFSEPDDLTTREVSPREASESAKQQGCSGVAWTYNEPTIYAEYVRDGAKAAHDAGLYAAMVTNGYFTKEFVNEVGPHLDAVNIDIKGFRNRPHIRYMGGKLEPTLRGTEMMHDTDVHVELTYLVIPDLNDDTEEIREFAEWVANLDPSIPVHFSRFHPDHEMRDRPATPVETLEKAHSIAEAAGLEFVYVGNVPGHEHNSTYCPDCGKEWIHRTGFNASVEVDINGECDCGREIYEEVVA